MAERCAVGLEPQSILFPIDKFSARQALDWVSRHHLFKHKTKKVDTTENYHRVRIENPKRFKPSSFRTIDFGEGGIKAVMACPKRKR